MCQGNDGRKTLFIDEVQETLQNPVSDKLLLRTKTWFLLAPISKRILQHNRDLKIGSPILYPSHPFILVWREGIWGLGWLEKLGRFPNRSQLAWVNHIFIFKLFLMKLKGLCVANREWLVSFQKGSHEYNFLEITRGLHMENLQLARESLKGDSRIHDEFKRKNGLMLEWTKCIKDPNNI